MNRTFLRLRHAGATAALMVATATATAADSVTGDPAVGWGEQILRQQPEQAVIAAYDELTRATEEAADNLLGAMGLSLRNENYRVSDDQGDMNWEGGVDMPLKVFRQKQAYRPLYRAYPELKLRHQQWLHWQSVGIARELLNDLVEKQVIFEHAVDAEKQARRLHEVLKTRQQAGDASRLEVLLARRSWSKARGRSVGARADVDRVLRTLGLWGIELDNRAAADLARAGAGNARVTGDVAEIAIHHPRYGWEQARQMVVLARKGLSVWQDKPGMDLYLGAKNDRPRQLPDDTALVLQLRLPFGNSPSYQASLAEQKQLQTRVTAELARLRRELTLAIVEAQLEVRKARELLPLAEDQFKAADAALKMSLGAYQTGEMNLQELLISQQQQLQAKLERALARVRLDRRIRELNQAAGVIQ